MTTNATINELPAPIKTLFALGDSLPLVPSFDTWVLVCGFAVATARGS